MKKYTALFAALTLVLALAGCGAETQTPMPGQSEQEEFTQNSTENVNETDGMTLLDSVFDTLSEGTDVTITLEQEGVRQSYPNTLDTYWAMRMPTSENFNWCGITKEDYSAASSEGEGKQNRLSLSGSKCICVTTAFFFCRRPAVMFYILLQATPFLDTAPQFLL